VLVERVQAVALVALPFVWLGAVLAISGLEAPLKFRAPGVTTPVALSIGRLVFRALNRAELVLLVGIGLALPGSGLAPWVVVLVGALAVVLLVQTAVLRPRLDRRALALLGGDTPPPSRLHLVYVALEGIKLVALAVLGVAVVGGVLALP
jgi:hypothetical protein